MTVKTRRIEVNNIGRMVGTRDDVMHRPRDEERKKMYFNIIKIID